jgi:hypothetical protein
MWYLTIQYMHWLVFRTHPQKCLCICVSFEFGRITWITAYEKNLKDSKSTNQLRWSGSASPVAGISCAYPCHMGGHCTLNPSRSPLSSAKIVCKQKVWMISLASSIVCLAPNTPEEVHHCCCWYFFIVALSMDQVTSLTQLMNQHEPTQPQLVGGHLMRFIRVEKSPFNTSNHPPG